MGTALDEATCTCWCTCKCQIELGNVEGLSMDSLVTLEEEFVANPSTTLRGACSISLPALEELAAVKYLTERNENVAEGLGFLAAFHTENKNLLDHSGIARLCSKCLLSFRTLSKELQKRRSGPIPFLVSEKNTVEVNKLTNVGGVQVAKPTREKLRLNHLILLHLLDRDPSEDHALNVLCDSFNEHASLKASLDNK